MKTVITLYALFLGISASVFGAPALADQPLPQRIVYYSDLNLSHTSGVKRLYRRISAAARAVCGQTAITPLQQNAAARECSKKAIAEAVRDVSNVNLTAYHLERTGQGSASQEKLAARK
jgi:UrcA family protein